MKLPLAVARFRELWRVLESAFALTDDRLVEKLASYPAAKQLTFDADELETLRALRGRASHAQARAKVGKQELIEVERECTRAPPRLKTLSRARHPDEEELGISDVGVHAMPVKAFVRADGTLVLVQRPTPLKTT